MDGEIAEAPGGVVRVLVGIAAALGGAALCVLLGTGTAHADEAQPSDGSLLVGVVRTVATTVDSAGSAVGQATRAVPHVAAALPARPAHTVVSPVSTAVDGVLASTPVVEEVTSPLVGTTPLRDLTTPVTGLVDTVVAPVSGADPALLAALGVLPRQLLASTEAVPADAVVVGIGATALRPVIEAVGSVTGAAIARTELPPVAPVPGGLRTDGALPTSASSSGAGPGTALFSGALLLALLMLLARHRTDRSAAPGSPVYDTDSSPD